MFLLLMFCYKTQLEYEILEVWLSEKKHQRHTVQAGLCYHSRTYSLTLAVFACHQYKSTAGYLQYLCQLLARLQLQRSLVETLVRSPQLLCLFLQRTLEKEALQASLVLWHRQHLKEGIHKKQMASEAKSKFSTGTMGRFQEIQARTWRNMAVMKLYLQDKLVRLTQFTGILSVLFVLLHLPCVGCVKQKLFDVGWFQPVSGHVHQHLTQLARR